MVPRTGATCSKPRRGAQSASFYPKVHQPAPAESGSGPPQHESLLTPVSRTSAIPETLTFMWLHAQSSPAMSAGKTA